MDWKKSASRAVGYSKQEEVVENEVMSNLPLQIALYCNVLFAPIWAILLIIFLDYEYCHYDELHKFLLVTVIVSTFVVETLRLYLGYEGNLRDKIPELAGFWMLSLFPQFLLQNVLLFNPYFRLRVMVQIAQSIMVILLSVQLISGYKGLKYISRRHAHYFRLKRGESDRLEMKTLRS